MKQFCGKECSYITVENDCSNCKYYEEFLQRVRDTNISDSAKLEKVNWTLDELIDLSVNGVPKESSIKRDDVMITDWLYHNGKPVRIVGITHDQFAQYRLNYAIGGLSISEPIDNFEPIPLTIEILEKNGFKQTNPKHPSFWVIEDFLYWECTNHKLYVKTGSFNVDIELYKCESVHQLQHALKLCGIEKKIII